MTRPPSLTQVLHYADPCASPTSASLRDVPGLHARIQRSHITQRRFEKEALLLRALDENGFEPRPASQDRKGWETIARANVEQTTPLANPAHGEQRFGDVTVEDLSPAVDRRQMVSRVPLREEQDMADHRFDGLRFGLLADGPKKRRDVGAHRGSVGDLHISPAGGSPPAAAAMMSRFSLPSPVE